MREEAILYLHDKDGYCYIHYKNKETKVVDKKSSVIIKRICFRYGRNLEETRLFVCKLLKIRQKAPVLLNVREPLLFFPMYAFMAKENMWISYNQIKQIKQSSNMNCIIYFKGGETLVLPFEKRSVQRQRRRCRKLLQLLNKSIV